MNITETEKKYLEDENTSIDNAMLFKEIKALRADLAEVKNNTSGERMTKEKVLAIKDRHKRLKAIEDNMHLFKDNVAGGKDNE